MKSVHNLPSEAPLLRLNDQHKGKTNPHFETCMTTCILVVVVISQSLWVKNAFVRLDIRPSTKLQCIITTGIGYVSSQLRARSSSCICCVTAIFNMEVVLTGSHIFTTNAELVFGF